MRLKLLYHWRHFRARLLSAQAVQKEAPLVVATVFKNEAPFLKEWLDFHLAQGIGRFYLADNFSSDNFASILAPFIEKGQVVLSQTRRTKMDALIQAQELNRLLGQIAKKESAHTWVAIIDVDEFLFEVKGQKLSDFLNRFSGQYIGSVFVNWMMFGTGGVKSLDPQKSLREQLLLRAHASLGEHKMGKPILYLPNQTGFLEGPHFAFLKGSATCVHGDGQAYQAADPRIVHEPLRINHYWYRSESYYETEKRAKRKSFGDERSGKREADHKKACNYEEDTLILKL